MLAQYTLSTYTDSMHLLMPPYYPSRGVEFFVHDGEFYPVSVGVEGDTAGAASGPGLGLDAALGLGLGLDAASGLGLGLDAASGLGLGLDAASGLGLDLDAALELWTVEQQAQVQQQQAQEQQDEECPMDRGYPIETVIRHGKVLCYSKSTLTLPMLLLPMTHLTPPHSSCHDDMTGRSSPRVDHGWS